jgi:hypothetical protein
VSPRICQSSARLDRPWNGAPDNWCVVRRLGKPHDGARSGQSFCADRRQEEVSRAAKTHMSAMRTDWQGALCLRRCENSPRRDDVAYREAHGHAFRRASNAKVINSSWSERVGYQRIGLRREYLDLSLPQAAGRHLKRGRATKAPRLFPSKHRPKKDTGYRCLGSQNCGILAFDSWLIQPTPVCSPTTIR